MKFSVCLSTGFEGVMYPIPFAGPEDFIEQGKLCERLGYDSVWGNDHITTQDYVRNLFPDTPPNFYEPLIVLAAIGAVTTKLKLGTALCVLPMRDPVYLAKQVISLDQMSNGRFILAVGLGAYREEFQAWAGSRAAKSRRGDMMDEGLKSLEMLFTEKSASFEGKYYSFKDVEMFPKSRKQPFPLYIGGHNLEALERAARYGQGWLPGWRPLNELAERIVKLKERAAELGRDPADIEIAPQFSVTIDKTMEAAEKRYMESGLVAHRVSLAYTGRDLSHQVVANLVGSPDVILEKVAKLKSIGIDHCSALMFPADTVSEMNDQIEWFAKDVMAKVS
ncbi:MAG: LLM class flavin-dependent oxidoreductase [Xanthobacteraceae bacterium]|nr:LLM class flavin-dependent oxidoreductase [Xanthobacteraceae bacterium]MBX3521793.1 LLM class flavin-dependent oxidoreductase [Xanthobacteraceae bacterium]MBX3550423.1 LLM class flavin-dependent oxidoreductase [Xanthobacteraceae bacterium]MCW5674596.1 LLM class flavin-dependent oxidoreductase [Xanthobacteraceae bacterium]MCW5676945.1 LLM class flavin-dependent oxidoreductase [Xanthobacteraceae bacterium]